MWLNNQHLHNESKKSNGFQKMADAFVHFISYGLILLENDYDIEKPDVY